MIFSRFVYRRPAWVGQDEFRLSQQSLSTTDPSNTSLKSGRSGLTSGIPDALSFDKIINGGTCPPCTLRDFMNYLIYIERSAENLQFYLWHRDYVNRFADINVNDSALAPEWTLEMEECTISNLQKEQRGKIRRDPVATKMFKGTDFDEKRGVPVNIEMDPFSTPPRTPVDESSEHPSSNASTYRTQAGDAFESVGVKQPFTIQPFRHELDRVIATYIVDGSPRQLNLSAKERNHLLQALAYTTHPSAFRQVVRSVDSSLRLQAHPNFIRWSICNGNTARVIFARGLGVFLIVVSLAAAVLLTLSRAPRGYRAIPAVGYVLGISTLIAAIKGMCVVLHGMHHRHVRPWELFIDEETQYRNHPSGVTLSGHESTGGKTTLRLSKAESEKYMRPGSFDSLGSSNSYEDEPWIVKYQKRNVVRKVFDRELWIQEPALRQVQDIIFVQAMVGAMVGAGILTAIFVCVPGGHMY